MPEPYRADTLAATRTVVVLLRLAVGAGDRILHGEVVDPETHTSRSFHRLPGLPVVLRDWLPALLVSQDIAHDEGPEMDLLSRNQRADIHGAPESEDPCPPS